MTGRSLCDLDLELRPLLDNIRQRQQGCEKNSNERE
jgi:hypothetical protein